MKKLLALMALVLGVVSCQTEPEGIDVNVGGEQTVTINVAVPETETRAGGLNSALGVFDNGVLGTADDNTTMRYILQVYYNGEASKERLVEYSDGKSVSFDVRLVPQRNYQFVVWADVVTDGKNDTDNHYNTSDLKNITLKGDWNAMDESRDAFTATELIENFNASKPINITLKRPFAKLRVVTTDMKALNNLGIVPTTATVEYEVAHYNAFNALAGKAIGDSKNRNIKHENFAIASYGENVAEGADMTLFSDYFFAEDDVVKFTLDVKDAKGATIKKGTFNTDIYAKRNYLTTIKGNILTENNSFDVTIDDAFAGEIGKVDGATIVSSTTDLIAKVNADVAAGKTEVAYDALGANVGSLDGTNFVPAGVTVTLRNANITGISRNNSAYGTLIFDNCTFSNNSAYSINFIGGNGHVIFNKCKLSGWCSFGSVTVEMNECNITGNGKYALVRSYNDFTMNECKIDCSNTNTTDAYHDGVSIGGGSVLTMTDCEMVVDGYEYGEAADRSTMDYSSYIIVDGKRLACNEESLNAALKNGNAVLMENDITVSGYLIVSDMKDKSINIDGNNNTLTTGLVYGKDCAGITLSNMTLVGSNSEYYTLYANSGKIEMTNVTVSSNFNQAVCFGGGGDAVLTNCNITGTANSDKYAAATIWCGDGRNLTINGGTYSSIFMNAQYHQDWINNGWVSADNHDTTHAASKITVNDGTINKLVLETELGADGYYTSATLVQNGGTINTLVENPQNLDLTGRVKYEKQN